LIRPNVRRDQLMDLLAQLPPCVIPLCQYDMRHLPQSN
jgi:hypothetical protein